MPTRATAEWGPQMFPRGPQRVPWWGAGRDHPIKSETALSTFPHPGMQTPPQCWLCSSSHWEAGPIFPSLEAGRVPCFDQGDISKRDASKGLKRVCLPGRALSLAAVRTQEPCEQAQTSPWEHEKDMAKAFDFPADAEPVARHVREGGADLPFQVSRSRPETRLSQFPEPGGSGWVLEGWFVVRRTLTQLRASCGLLEPAAPGVSTHRPLWAIPSFLFLVKLH